MNKLHLVFEAIEMLKSQHPPISSIKGSIAPDFIKSSHGIRFCSCDYFVLEHYRMYGVIPARRKEIVVQRRRCVADIAENGNLASGVFLFNRLTSCICKPDKREVLTNFDDVISALPSFLSKHKNQYTDENGNLIVENDIARVPGTIEICSV